MDDTDRRVVADILAEDTATAADESVFVVERAELFRCYARIIEMPRRIDRGNVLAGSLCKSAAQCFRIVADAIERRDPNLPQEWLG